MGQQVPLIGDDVTALMGGSPLPGVPPVGADVSHLMSGEPNFRSENARDAGGKPIVDSLADFGKEATAGLNPVNLYHALKAVVTNLPGAVRQVGLAQGSLYQKAEQSYKDGDYIAAARHMASYLLPLIGPRIDQSGDFMQQGEYAKGLGAVADIGLQAALPMVAGKVTLGARSLLKTTANPADAAAVRFGESRGIPVDVGTKTGNGFVKDVQKRLSGTLGGASPMERAAGAQTAHLDRVGRDLAGNANAAQGIPGAPASPVTAGEGVRAALTKKIQDLHATATQAYDRLRQFENAAQQRVTQAGGVQAPPGAAAAFTNVPLAVDIGATKTAMKSLYEKMLRESELGIPMQGGKGRMLAALDGLMRGPDIVPLSVADDALGNLKAMARGAEMPELRTGGQASAAQAVQAMDAQVRAAAARGGPDVLKALDEGRAATSQKYGVADALDLFGNEPRQAYNQLTAGKDLGLNKLRAVKLHAPDQLPTIARAYLEEALDLATAEGGFAHADKLFADWQKMGANTKLTLFPKPGQVQALDDFFLLAKKLTANRNPSGTANVAHAFNATQIAAYFPAKWTALLLTTPRGVRAMTTAMRLSVNASPAARAGAFAQVARAAQAEGLAIPATADKQP